MINKNIATIYLFNVNNKNIRKGLVYVRSEQ